MIKYGSLPFAESIDFFRDKVNLPTRAWTDIWEGMHARAFVVAGAIQSELLSDLRGAVDKAIADGTTLEEFRKNFRSIVKQRGWQYNGGEGWRTRVIYDTNLRTAYQAGRYKQLTDPELLKVRPYWRYSHSDLSVDPRPEHLAWDNLVLRHDAPFWQTHYPPNGWGCKCKVFAESERSLKRKKLKPSDSPEIKYKEITVGSKGPSPRTVRVPEGVDPSWAYNVGDAAWGRQLSEQAFDEYKGKWKPLTFGGPENFNRPDRLLPASTNIKVGKKLTSTTATEKSLKKLLKTDDKVFSLKRGKMEIPVHVNAEILAGHINLNRTPFIPFLPDLLEKPQEAWITFEQNEGSGKVVLRMRLLKLYKVDKSRAMIMVANASKGHLESWTFIPTSNLNELKKQRRGVLIYSEDTDE